MASFPLGGGARALWRWLGPCRGPWIALSVLALVAAAETALLLHQEHVLLATGGRFGELPPTQVASPSPGYLDGDELAELEEGRAPWFEDWLREHRVAPDQAPAARRVASELVARLGQARSQYRQGHMEDAAYREMIGDIRTRAQERLEPALGEERAEALVGMLCSRFLEEP